MKTLSVQGVFLTVVITAWTTVSGAGWEVPVPKTTGIRLYVEKHHFKPGETVRFMLYFHTKTSRDDELITVYEYTNTRQIPGSDPPQFTADRVQKKVPKGQWDPDLGLCTLVNPGAVTHNTLLEDSYYVIQHQTDRGWREFFTSKKEPFKKELKEEKGLVWGWNQKDNEGTHRAKPGEWRLVIHGRHLGVGDLSGEKRAVRFTIGEKGAKPGGATEGTAKPGKTKERAAKPAKAKLPDTK